MTLEALISEAAARGLKAINLWPVHDGWQGNVSYDRVSWKVGIDADPIVALRMALGDRTSAPERSEEDIFG
jgi:hypothetical protein